MTRQDDMTKTDTVATDLARAAGILPKFQGIDGGWYDTAPETERALLAAMGIDTRSAAGMAAALADLTRPRALPRWQVVEPDQPGAVSVSGDWCVTLENGDTIEGRGTLPRLPMGRHRLESAGEVCWILAAPPVLPLPPLGWGMTLPLYGLRPKSGALASYEDLTEAAASLSDLGAGFLGINPIHAGFPTDPTLISPYSPSHRRRLSTAHLAAGEPAPTDLSPLIDYPAALGPRRRALEARFAAEADSESFATFRDAEGEGLELFALHQAISDVHGPFWCDWPESLRAPDGAGVAAFAAEHSTAVSFHAWCQWQAEQQLGTASRAAGGMAQGLYLDLAVGTHPYGAETWAAPQDFAVGVSLGAPPDAFSPGGQSWTLAPFNPRALVETGFAAFAETLAKQLQFSRMLRIDHILGVERSFWVPQDGTPGGYVAMPREALLAVIRIEATRADAVIVGEDLGNVPGGLRADLDASGILGCSVAMFEWDETGEPRDPASYREASLASFGTHDLPTWAGWRLGRDTQARAGLGLISAEAAEQAQIIRSKDVAQFDRMADGAELPQIMAHSRARLVALQLEDTLGLVDQANLPGTTEGHPNWQRRLPIGARELADHPQLVQAAGVMSTSRR